MNHIYIGDRQLDPEDDNTCSTCDGAGKVQDWIGPHNEWGVFDCPDCTPDTDPFP